ncbi:hypothetical protein AMRN_2459 [Malaciobacter marinus]|uniref:Uncharacterized protein n=1 Tax=Malaciobacter marinus TaxID=505249 RepID=A0A347TNI2_9BACT|nr:hypothetical protein [Malaciobacter marinus]AXX88160.1 hypothetical protein AMRN_2459 [Malaciobacter marinus]PHO14014.1 hypothetical protein CPH92_14130 [Malaciobacter marinus]
MSDEYNECKKNLFIKKFFFDIRLEENLKSLEYYKNDTKVILWYEKAYTQGSQDSLNITGLIYELQLKIPGFPVRHKGRI